MSSKYLLVRCGTRQVIEVFSSSGHEYITVLTACSAAGDILPPFILYKGKNLYQRWLMGGPVGSFYGVSESGWMDSINFLSWFHNQFMSAVRPLTESGPVVLIFDGHYSHVSLELIKLARDNNIHLLCLPPNTTHILQPLDVGLFAVLKKNWRKVLKEYQLQTKGGKACKETFPKLLTNLLVALTLEVVRSGFKGTSIVPLSREHVLSKLPVATDLEPEVVD